MNSNSMKQTAGFGIVALIVLLTASGGVTALEVKGTAGDQKVFVQANDPDTDTWQQQIGDIVTLRATHTDMVPVIDGVADDPAWAEATAVTVPLTSGDVKDATLKAVYTDKEIILQVSWADATRDEQYRPWVWDAKQGRYVAGQQVEDALLVSYEVGCEWHPSLLSGQEYDFDGWLWLAARSNPVGQAVDIYGGTIDHWVPDRVLKQYDSRSMEEFPEWQVKFLDARNGILTEPWQNLMREYRQPRSQFEEIFVGYATDGNVRGNGQASAFTERMDAPTTPPLAAVSEPGLVKAAMTSPEPVTVPQYLPVKLSGDAGDVAAKGQWQDGRWTVEFKRILVTDPASDDYSFERATQFSIHVFDHTEDLEQASESWRILLEFEPAGTDTGGVLTTQNNP